MTLVVESLVIDHGAIRAINSVSFKVSTGKLTAVIGANGAGKTTLLRGLSGLKEISEVLSCAYTLTDSRINKIEMIFFFIKQKCLLL